MSQVLQEQISQLKKSEWVDLQGLISCATTYLAASSEFPSLSCDSITLLGRGSYNTVYKLEFNDNNRLAASVSNLNEEKFDPEAKRSEIETMKFVRESGIYPDIPVPKIFVWETDFINPRCLGGPYKSMEDLWRAQLEKQLLHALQEWCALGMDLIDPDDNPRCTPQMFSELFQLLSSLIPHFQPPKSYLPLVLHHPDIVFRNILFDESSISSGDLRITGLIDWGGAQILPLMFTAKYPDDLRTTGEYPFEKPGWDYNEHWYTVPCDWTSTGDPSQWPEAYGLGHKPIDYGPSVRGVIDKFYLRAYFNACYAEQLHTLHGDADLARATLFRDATYYMKFHEVVCSGWFIWSVHKAWIRETYWRLRMAGHGGKESEELIIGPNLYRDLVEEPLRDLGLSGEYPVAIQYDLDPVTLKYAPVAYHT